MSEDKKFENAYADLAYKNGKTKLEQCPYCGQSHVDDYLCLKARAQGVTKADLPDVYYMDTGEVTKPHKRNK